jgi:iron(III) transport system ATP-binding protein
VQVLVGPQSIELTPDPEGAARITGREFLGREWLYQVQRGDLRLRLRLPLERDHPRGLRVQVGLRSAAPARLFPSGVDLVVSSSP